MTKPSLLILLMALLPGLPGCAMMNSALQEQPAASAAVAPTVEASPVELRRAPSLNTLAAWYCPQIIDNPVARLACGTVLGPPPARDQLAFEFGLTVTARNPNQVPIPALDLLLALTLFQGQEAQGMGAICVSLCAQGEASCTGAARPGACTSAQTGVPRIEDFVQRIPGLIQDLVTGKAEQELRKSLIAARGDVRLDLAYVMGIDQVLGLVRKLANHFVQDLLAGRQATLAIPVSAKGTLFVSLPAVGRLGVGFGPLQTTWQVLPR